MPQLSFGTPALLLIGEALDLPNLAGEWIWTPSSCQSVVPFLAHSVLSKSPAERNPVCRAACGVCGPRALLCSALLPPVRTRSADSKGEETGDHSVRRSHCFPVSPHQDILRNSPGCTESVVQGTALHEGPQQTIVGSKYQKAF